MAHAWREPIGGNEEALFYAYTYRWARARDDVRIAPELFRKITSVRAQLLGAGSSAIGHRMPEDDDAPPRVVGDGS